MVQMAGLYQRARGLGGHGGPDGGPLRTEWGGSLLLLVWVIQCPWDCSHKVLGPAPLAIMLILGNVGQPRVCREEEGGYTEVRTPSQNPPDLGAGRLAVLVS